MLAGLDEWVNKQVYLQLISYTEDLDLATAEVKNEAIQAITLSVVKKFLYQARERIEFWVCIIMALTTHPLTNAYNFGGHF